MPARQGLAYVGKGTRVTVGDGWTTVLLVASIALAATAVWLGWQWNRARLKLREARELLDARTTELESARLELQRLSTEDSLTALANHEQFLEFVEREWRRGRREKQPVSLIFLDVDHFRSFNRQYGRRAGDECLRQIGKAVEGLAGRAGDLIARYHRDEFAVVLSGTDTTGALRVANKIRQAIENLEIPAARDADTQHVTVSVSVASAVPDRESNWEELDLIKAARHALRDARAAGGNRVLTATLETPSGSQVSTINE
jgi:diguanylate cyclase (GGDEF)-like protein